MTDSGWLHYRDLKSRCPVCKRPAHIAKRNGNFYFVDDEYNPFVRHAPVKTTEAVFRFFANGYRREHGTEPEVTGNRKLSERDILSGMRQMLYDLSNESGILKKQLLFVTHLLLRQTRILHGKVSIWEGASVLRGILLEPVVGHIEVIPVL